MSKRKKNKNRAAAHGKAQPASGMSKSPPRSTPRSTPSSGQGRLSASRFTGGIILLSLACAASLALVLENLGALSLPGCGENSGCARAAASVWGKIPGLNWPLSSVGLAYFLGLLVAFITSRNGIPGGLRLLVRLSTLGSVVLMTAMFTNDYVCKYCLVVHALNLLFWLLLEFLPSARSGSIRTLGMVAGCFAISVGGLLVIEHTYQKDVLEQAEKEREESIEGILPEPGRTHTFTGRYHYGPKDAPIHVVMFTDFQCPDCNTIELQVQRLFNERTDVSLSIKHFPFCTDCNKKMTRNLHPNACWAARAAETAGILRGNEGFWEMYVWLFQRDGAFSDSELSQGLQQMGYNPSRFISIMRSGETERLVLADIEEGYALGLHYTPMIFINGKQVRGVATPNVLYNSVIEIAARNPQPVYDAAPPDATSKFIEDWRLQRPFPRFAADTFEHANGPENATLDILVWGDYREEKTAELDQIIHRLTGQRSDVRYTFRHYPVNPLCNEHVTATYSDETCRAHRAVETAGMLGGNEAYWAVHRWMIDNQEALTVDRLRQLAIDHGLDPDLFLETMKSDEVEFAITEDVEAGGRLRFRGIPAVFVNRKRVPRIWHDEKCIIDQILSEALGEDLGE